jgi:thiol-disulfide isomerase/thioredoxin
VPNAGYGLISTKRARVHPGAPSLLRTKIARLAFVGCVAAPLVSCSDERGSAAPTVIETIWTHSAAERTQNLTEEALKKSPLGGQRYALPELRIYDGRQKLIFHMNGASPGQTAAILGRVISADRPVAGPTFQETLADLETHDHEPAATVVTPGQRVIIFDYWAEWCIPCKALEKELLAWLKKQPEDSLQIVRVEADLAKLEREKGGKVFMFKKGPDGKLAKVEMK